MLRVLLVDDEPYILQGLQVLIDWEKEGFTVAGTATDGKEALCFLQDNPVDLIMADINMPVVSGLELVRRIREENISDAYFVILSGFADFSYAQKAIRYNCEDYILKPIEKEQLQEVLRKIVKLRVSKEEEDRESRKMEEAYLARNLLAVIRGKYDEVNLACVRKHMHFSACLRYIEISLDENKLDEEFSDEDKRHYQRKLQEACASFLKEHADYCVFDVSGQERVYDIGFVYCDDMAKESLCSEKEYLEHFMAYLKPAVNIPVIMLVGKQVDAISSIAKSYSTVCILRSCRGFRSHKNIYYYDEEMQVSSDGVILCKNGIDSLLAAIEQNQPVQIHKAVDILFEEMQQVNGLAADTKNLNINYLLFQLIHLATQQDDNVNQEEILRLISEHSFHEGFTRGSKAHVSEFALEYAEYLTQLRKNMSWGILGEVECEVKKHYADNLTLKEFSERYYVNTAYLGQLFRKKHGCSFKDYLNAVRIDAAASLLIHTDKKILQIAEEVGYHNFDYFVNRFIGVKGCTPAKYRRQMRG